MKKKKNPIYGDSLKVERNDSLFFCTLLFPTIIFFCFSFELYGKLVRVSLAQSETLGDCVKILIFAS